MAEAIIGRSGVALSSGGGVSNETKKSLGLDNNATLDDVINTIVAKDPTMATMIVTIKNPDGTIPPESTKIKMVPVSGSTFEYSTNSVGQCLFKTNSGQCNFVETGNVPYIDLTQNSINNYAAVIGEVYHIDLVRKTKIGESVNLNLNQNVIFSSACKSVDIHCYGAGGGGGTGWAGTYSFALVNGVLNRALSGKYGGRGGSGYYNKKVLNPEYNMNYPICIGDGGIGGWMKNGRNTNTMNTNWSIKIESSGNGYNGFTGGTTSFSNIVYAIGGSGGGNAYEIATMGGIPEGYAGTDGKGGNGGAGGAGGGWGYKYVGPASVGYGNAFTYGDQGYKGSNGYIILNNFTYK